MESRTRSRVSRMLAAGFVAVACAAGAASASVEQTGFFALLGGTPRVSAKLWVSPAAGGRDTLQIRQFNSDAKPILAYDVDMEHVMHMIIVRDDFATFDHVHPNFDATTGTFTQAFSKAPNHRYYVYADSTPRGLSQQVFRFTVGTSGAVGNDKAAFTASKPAATSGPYSVTLATTMLVAGAPYNLDVTVSKNGAPAGDLSPYLGAAAHVVFINTSTLAYVHLHPALRGQSDDDDTAMSSNMHMDMSTQGKAGPLMTMHVPGLPAGTYKLWIQFRGNGELYTVPFTLVVR